MSLYTATFTNPQENYAGTGMSKSVPIAYGEKQAEIGAVSAMVFHISEEVLSKYDVETDSTNPLQLNSTVVVTRNTDGKVVFRGYVMSKPVMRDFEQGAFMEVACFGKEGVLTQTLCPRSGSYQWTVSSSATPTGTIDMQASDAWDAYPEVSTLWPDPDTAPNVWIQNSDCPSDTLDAGILAGATDIVLAGAGGGGFAPRGYVLIDTEYIYYPCCWYNTAIGKWQLGSTADGAAYECVRGELGTTAAAHLAAADVYNKRAKNIAPGVITLRKSGTVLNQSKYTSNMSLGCLILNEDDGGTPFTADYYVYDEDATIDPASVVVTLGDIVDAIIKADDDDGGAGFAAGNVAVTAPLGINRFEYDPSVNSPYAWNVIHDLMDALGIGDEYSLYYDHTADKVKFEAIAQKLVADIAIDYLRRTDSDVTLEDVVNGVLVKYENEAAMSIVSASRAWHPAAGGGGTSPTHWEYDPNAPSWADSAGHGTSDPAGAGGLSYCVDGNTASKFGGVFEAQDPTGEWLHSYWWFGDPVADVPPMTRLSRVGISVGPYRVCGKPNGSRNQDIPGADGQWEVRVDGCTDFNTNTHTGTDWTPILVVRSAQGFDNGATNLAEVTDIANKDVNALRIVWVCAPGPKTAGEYYWGYVHEFEVDGSVSGANVYIQTTDDATKKGDMNYVYAPLTHRKLRGGVNSSGGAGAARTKQLEIGASNLPGAQALGRTLLMQRLLLYNSRTYEVSEFMGTLPELGLTVKVDEDEDGAYEYTGLIRGYNITITPEETSVTLRLLDYAADYLE